MAAAEDASGGTAAPAQYALHAVPPIIPTGHGYSLLDTVLHLRSRDGVVANTFTRVFCCGKLAPLPGGRAAGPTAAAAAAAAELSELHTAFLSAHPGSAEVTGLLVAQPGSWWSVVEGPPEAVVGLMRHVAGEAARRPARILAARVVVHVEDCPTRAFGPFSVRPLTLAPDAAGAAALAAEVEDAHPVTAAVPVYRGVVEMGHQMVELAEGGDPRALLGSMEERFPGALPSDERVAALACASKLPTLSEWVSMVDGQGQGLDFELAAHALPPR